MKFSARFFLTPFLFAIFYLLFAIVPASAQTNPYTVPNTNPDVPKNLHTWTQNVMIEVMSAMSCQLSGIDPTDPKTQCLGVDQKTGKIGFVEGGGGAIGIAGHMIAQLYTPPLRTGDYFKYLAGNFGIVKQASAATGFEGLKPVQNLWVAFRNIVYLLFVVVFVVIGLAIMLRVKIDPRTVMTIQNQIPKIIIGLLLVTFSFAIAGFLIDLMYVVMFLSYEIISSAVTPGLLTNLNPLYLQEKTAIGVVTSGSIQEGGVFGIANTIALSLRSIIQNLIGLSTLPFGLTNLFDLAGLKLDPIGNPAYSVVDFLVDFASVGIAWRFAAQAAEIIGNHNIFSIPIPTGTAGGIAAGVLIFAIVEEFIRFALPYLIVFLIVMIALFFALFRLWFTLILAYIGILLDVVFAPFWIVAGLLPGSPIGFSAWLRSIIANLAAFPAAIIMFLLAKIFIDAFGECKLPACNPATVFAPPLVGDLPGTDLLGNFIGLGILLMTPSVVAMIKSALKAPSLQAGGPIAAALGVGAGVLTGPVGALKQGFALSFGARAAEKFGLGGKQPITRPPVAGSGGGGR
jgi:hypothetical protein